MPAPPWSTPPTTCTSSSTSAPASPCWPAAGSRTMAQCRTRSMPGVARGNGSDWMPGSVTTVRCQYRRPGSAPANGSCPPARTCHRAAPWQQVFSSSGTWPPMSSRSTCSVPLSSRPICASCNTGSDPPEPRVCMLRRSLSVAALDARILRRDAAPVLVMIVIPLLFVPFLMPGARAQLVAGGHLGATGAEYAVPGLAILFALLNAQQVLTGFFREKDWATWHRLRIAPVSFPELVVGKSLTALGAQFAQLLVVLLGGALLFGYRPNGPVL